MTWFAGFHASRLEDRGAAVLRRIAAERNGRFASDGPLRTVFDGSVASDADNCLIVGTVHGTDTLARDLGMPWGGDARPVILEGFRRTGAQVLNRLRGQFALLVWDSVTGTGFAGQDPMALSAIFYAEVPGGFAFGTEIRELLPLLPTAPAPDAESVARTLATVGPSAGRTLFAGVRRMTGGACLLFERDRVSVYEHWTPKYEGTLSQAEVDGRLRQELGSAVDRALAGESRSAVLLSGGLDSSTVACVGASRGTQIKGYSARFPDHPDLDESRYAKSVADRWGIEITSTVIPKDGVFAAALDYVEMWQLPVFGVGYGLECVLIGQLVQDGFTTVLDGQGGDELFCASPYLPADLLRHGRLLRSFGMSRRTPERAEISVPRELMRYWWMYGISPTLPLPLLEHWRRYRYPVPPTPRWLVDSMRAIYGRSIDEWSWRRGHDGPLWWRWLSDVLLRGPAVTGRSDYLRQRSILHGVRGGSPLLDFDLAQMMLKVPPGLAYDPAYGRPLMRTVTRGLLPEEVRTRTDKSNLFAFYRDVMAGPDLEWSRRVLNDPNCLVWEYAERSFLAPLLDDMPPAGGRRIEVILSVLHNAAMLECWLRQREDPESVGRLREEIQAGRGA